MNKKEMAKVGMSTLLLALLFTVIVDWKEVGSTINKVKMRYYIIAYMFATSGTFISIYRWDKIVKFQGEAVNIKRLISLYYIGKFYNVLIPGSMSGDVIRGYKTANEDGDGSKLFSSVAVERVAGLIATLIVMAGSLVYLRNTLFLEIKIQLILFIIAVSVLLIAVTSESAQTHLVGILPDHHLVNKFKQPIIDISDSLRIVANPRFIIEMVAISLFFIFISKFTVFFVAMSIGTSLPYVYILATTTVVGIVTMVPISFGGLGIREGLFVYFFSHAGVEPGNAIAIGLIGYSMRIIDAIIGGILNLIEKT